MGKLKKRLFLVSIALMVFGLVSVSAIQAATYGQTVQAYQGVKIIYNGNELTGTTQPYIINNSTYVPLRMLMEGFGDKFIYWDSVGYRVLITDKEGGASSEQLKQKDAEITTLKSEIATLKEKLQEYEDDEDDADISVSDIKAALKDEYKYAGDEYFDDDDIDTTISSVSGDEDKISYVIRLDFSDSDEYDDLTETDESDIEDFLDAVESTIEDEIDGTDFEGAEIVGKLYDNDRTSYYAEYEDGDYTYSWEDEISTSDIKAALVDECDGADSFDDDGIVTYISVSGDDDDLTYTIRLDFTNADDYDDLSEIDESEVEDYLDEVRETIEDEIDGTDFEDADISGLLRDNDHSGINVVDDEGDYDFNGW